MTPERTEQRQEREPELGNKPNPLKRNPGESLKEMPPRDTERFDTQLGTKGRRVAAGLAVNPGEDPVRQETKDDVTRTGLDGLRQAKTPPLEKNLKEVQKSINETRITPLLQKWNAVFRPENPGGISGQSLQEYRTAFGDPVRGMLNQAGKEIVMLSGGRIRNRVEFATGWMKELDTMLKSPLLHSSAVRNPDMKNHIANVRNYITEVRQFFKGVLDGDPARTQAMQMLKPERKRSADYRNGKSALKMLGLLAAVGIGLFSALIDFKNKKLSVYTLAWLGLAGYLAGAFKGHNATVADQLKFMTKAKWEALGMNGAAGARAIDMVRNSPKSRTMLKDIKDGKTTPEQYIRMLAGTEPEGENALAAQKLRAVASKGTNTFVYMMEKILGVTDPVAKKLHKDMIKSDTTSQTVASEVGDALPSKPVT